MKTIDGCTQSIVSTLIFADSMRNGNQGEETDRDTEGKPDTVDMNPVDGGRTDVEKEGMWMINLKIASSANSRH
jgi:hypothetical protein